MRPVRDEDGAPYLLVERSADTSRVRDPRTGEERRLPTDRLSPADGALGVVADLVDRGPLPVRALLSDHGLCESDLHGLLAELRAAGLVREATVGGRRGYAATDAARAAVARAGGGSGGGGSDGGAEPGPTDDRPD
jgi:hypothetical protein